MHTTHRVIPVAMPPIDSMRAPGEAIGTLALEAALDELALELDMDPLALRLQNIPEREPQSGKPFASNDLRRCLELMVGNRSSFLHTLIDERDAFRVIPAPQQWIAEARLSLADYRDVVGRALADQLLAAE